MNPPLAPLAELEDTLGALAGAPGPEEAFEACLALRRRLERAREESPDPARAAALARLAARGAALFRERIEVFRAELAASWPDGPAGLGAPDPAARARAAFLGLDLRFLSEDGRETASTLEEAGPGARCVYDLEGFDVHAPDLRRLRELRWAILDGAGDEPFERAARFLEPEVLAGLFDRHVAALFATRRAVIRRNRLPHALAVRVGVLRGRDYDSARRSVMDLVRRLRDSEDLLEPLRDLLHPELGHALARLMLDHRHGERRELETLFAGVAGHAGFRARLDAKCAEIVQTAGDGSDAPYRDALERWERELAGMADELVAGHRQWEACYRRERDALYSDPLLDDLRTRVSLEEVHALVRYLFPRLYESVPHIVDLRAPTILLVGGATGTGKSTIARMLSERLGIHIHFSADLLREVQRGVTTPETHPALHRSSFDADPLLPGFFEQAIRISEGLEAVIRRLVDEGVSAVVEGVPLVPGFLAEDCYENANVIHVTVAVPEAGEHAARFHGRAREASRRDASRYTAELEAIREIQDALARLARGGGGILLVNRDLAGAVAAAEAWVRSPFVDRYRRPSDPAVEEAWRAVAARRACPDGARCAGPAHRPPRGGDLFQGLGAGEARALEVLGRPLARRLAYRYMEELGRSSRAFLDVRDTLFDWVLQLSGTEGTTYDEARRSLSDLVGAGDLTPHRLETLFFPRDRRVLAANLHREGFLHARRAATLADVEDPAGLTAWIEGQTDLLASTRELHLRWLRRRAEAIREEVERIRGREADLARWRATEEVLLGADPEAGPLLDAAGLGDVIALLRLLVTRLHPGTPGAKNLDRPTFVLVGGAPATGKNSVSRALKQSLAIPTSLRTDLVREVMRRHLDGEAWEFLHSSALALPAEGEQRYHAEYLELFFRPVDLIAFKARWREEVLRRFFANAAASFLGVQRLLDRLVKENQSAIIEGPAVLPGLLAPGFFEKANVVQVVLCVDDEHEHYRRFIERGLPREAFLSTRFIHHEIKRLARAAGVAVVDNADMAGTLRRVVQRAGGGLCDRPLPTRHALLDEVLAELAARF